MSDDIVVDHPPARRRWNVGWPPVVEVFLIALGVFLGLAGEQWRDRADRRDRAHEALRRIQAEIALNAAAVAKVRDYHATTHQRLKEAFALPDAERAKASFRLDGIRPVHFEQTAWQLAQGMQALAEINTDLAFTLARLYGVQENYTELTKGITNAMYLRPPVGDAIPFLQSLSIYYDDIVEIERALDAMYKDVQPQVDRALDR